MDGIVGSKATTKALYLQPRKLGVLWVPWIDALLSKLLFLFMNEWRIEKAVSPCDSQKSYRKGWDQDPMDQKSSRKFSVLRLGSEKPLSEECKVEVTGHASGPYLVSKAGKC